MAAGYTLRAIRLRLDAGLAPQPRPPITRPLGTHPRFAELILNEALLGCARRGWEPARSGMLLVGHGTGRDPTSGGTARRHAATVMHAGRFAEVGIAFLDEPPTVPEALARLESPHVVVVGLFLDRGEHGEADIAGLLAGSGARAYYTGPLGVDPLVPDLVLDQLRRLDGIVAA
jgi:sirohydrochlorin cobaltochelatase